MGQSGYFPSWSDAPQSAFVPAAATLIAQLRVDAKTNEHKAALQLLGFLPIRDKIVTADALFTHRDFAQAVRDQGGGTAS